MTTAQALKHAARIQKAADELDAAVGAVPFGQVVGIVGHVAIADAHKSVSHARTLAACLRLDAGKFARG